MSRTLRIRRIEIYPLAIPMRLRFEHAAAARSVADPVVVRLVAEAPFAAHAGFGETLARRYVSDEDASTVCDDVRHIFAPILLDLRAGSFGEAVAFARDRLPTLADGRPVVAARAAVELALLDLAGRVFNEPAHKAAMWLDLPGFGPPGCLDRTRYSGIVVGRTRRRLQWLVRAQRCYGLRDFKLKVAVEGWQDRLRWAAEVLGRGDVTLRADANAGFDFEQAVAAGRVLRDAGAEWLEQPLSRRDDDRLAELARETGLKLLADESLLTVEDADRLIDASAAGLNVRIAKNGGLIPAWQIAATALRRDAAVVLGCMVGETSILSAAGVHFLRGCPGVRFAEGAFGRWLLRRDVASAGVQFGPGGRVRPPAGGGLGVRVEPDALRELAAAEPVMVPL